MSASEGQGAETRAEAEVAAGLAEVAGGSTRRRGPPAETRRR
jgi:hypothetical protein